MSTHSPSPASWVESVAAGAVLPTMGLTTAGEPGPRSIRLSSVTSLRTCGGHAGQRQEVTQGGRTPWGRTHSRQGSPCAFVQDLPHCSRSEPIGPTGTAQTYSKQRGAFKACSSLAKHTPRFRCSQARAQCRWGTNRCKTPNASQALRLSNP